MTQNIFDIKQKDVKYLYKMELKNKTAAGIFFMYVDNK